MTVVALAALASTGWVLVGRSREYLKSAQYYDQLAALDIRTNTIETETCKSFQRVIEGSTELAKIVAPHEKAAYLERIQRNKEWIDVYKQDIDRRVSTITRERNAAGAYRRAARYPWLGPPRIKSGDR
jgi:hypothetical protein